MAESILTPHLLRRLEQFQLLSQRRSKSAARGERQSRARGQSVEFADHRNYTHGDDLRYLDWNLYGRLEKLFVKLYEEERELPVTIFLDASESMNFGDSRKFLFALQVAAAVGYVALCGFDRVSVFPFPERPEDASTRNALRVVRGRASAFRFFDQLSQLRAGGSAGLNNALRRSALQIRRPGWALVLSDFLDPEGYEDGLKALAARGFQVNAVQILAPEEISPGQFGDLRVIDSETGVQEEVTFGRYRLQAYQETVRAFVDQVKDFCHSRGMAFFSVSSDTPLEELLLKQLKAAQIWK